MVIVDRLTKYSHFITMAHPFIVSMVVVACMDHVFKLYGNPSTIMSDRGPTFTSQFWHELFRLQGVAIHLSFSYHPQSND